MRGGFFVLKIKLQLLIAIIVKLEISNKGIFINRALIILSMILII